ncbi:MAG: hypothetical protein JJE51_00985 [Thermoanaerobaculia bacterium]|nr:hypothetical protein [Thermoanaerobaculia bacterium]
MSDDRFFERLRADASGLRYEPDSVTLSRLAAKVRARIAQPTVAQLLALWFRPLAASLAAIALAAAIGLTTLQTDDLTDLSAEPIEISMAGGDFSVGD